MSALLDLTCWRDGRLMPLREAGPTLLDLGFIHCDATYDVSLSHGGRLFLFDDHEQRFRSSSQHFGLPLPAGTDLAAISECVLDANGLDGDALVWWILWRGVPASGNPRDLASCPTHLVVYAKPMFDFARTGNAATVHLDTEARRAPDACWGQAYKNFAWIELTMSQQAAIGAGFDTALVLDPDGLLAEGPGFNVAIVRDGKVLTPARNCLRGISMLAVERLCARLAIPFERTDIPMADVLDCDELFLTSTVGGVIPVRALDQRTMPPAPVTARLLDAYRQALADPAWSHVPRHARQPALAG
jgi:branched-chain amino acid aminotransferase